MLVCVSRGGKALLKIVTDAPLTAFGSTIKEPQMRRVWTVIALCAETAMPDDVPWRKAVAEQEYKPV